METGNGEAKCKRSLGMRPSKERKSFKFSLRAVPTQSLESTKSAAEEKSIVKKWDLVIKCNRKKNVETATGPGKNSSPHSETRSAADQIDDKAPSKQFTGTEKSAFYEKEQKVNGHVSDQEGCLALTSTSEPHAGFEVRVRQVPSFESQEELLQKTVHVGRLPEKEMTKISNHEGAQKEYHDSLKARARKLRQETCMLSRELQKHAAMCMELSDANRLLMDELKKMCEPCVIQILEAKNPDNNPQNRSRNGEVKIESSE